ncbi:TolC family protein [Mucilaginibacter sp.]|uniref:TolC family protein n=1 Tax=Mucilaginibacter sp. TaxID=1882438 RepID=UPI0025D79D18|nr:TolC family protein [Mucilaginibacter sp.]
MKIILFRHATSRLTGIILCLVFVCQLPVLAQQNPVYPLSLQQAVSLAKIQNKQVQAAKSEESASDADFKDAKAAALPTILASGDYQRFSSLTLYSHGLSDVRSVPKRPTSNGDDLGVSANFNLYAGGRQKAFETEQSSKKDLAAVSTQEQAGSVSLQSAAQYLDLIRLNDQKRFIDEQIIRAETRLKNINALYRNQKVTRSDVLRAELNLSAVNLNLDKVQNDIAISNQKLNVLLNLPDSTRIITTDSAAMPRPIVDTLLGLVTTTAVNAYAIRKSSESIRIQEARIKGVKSNFFPTASLYSAYGFSYPNTIFYPPVDQGYSIGFVGFKIQYNISSIYQNKHKTSASRIRLQELEFVKQNISDNIKQEAGSLLIKYREALNRIAVTQKSIEQARVNYKIVSAKYFNQLALLTDLLDADNLYQETRYNLVQAETSAQFIYYRLLFTSGKL